MNLQADHVTVDNLKHVSVFTGNVVLTQGTLMIRGDRMTMTQDAQGFRHATVYGNLAYFHQKNDQDDDYIEGYAERMEYDEKTKLFQMFTRASLKKGNDDVHGAYISYTTDTQLFEVTGGSGDGANAGAGRVRALMIPKPQAKPQAPVDADAKAGANAGAHTAAAATAANTTSASSATPTEPPDAGISLRATSQISAPPL